MRDDNTWDENILPEENSRISLEDIQEKTSYHLSKLFEYFGEEEEKILE